MTHERLGMAWKAYGMDAGFAACGFVNRLPCPPIRLASDKLG
jgi:hypothetical protein